jgi:hypothetical protein
LCITHKATLLQFVFFPTHFTGTPIHSRSLHTRTLFSHLSNTHSSRQLLKPTPNKTQPTETSQQHPPPQDVG